MLQGSRVVSLCFRCRDASVYCSRRTQNGRKEAPSIQDRHPPHRSCHHSGVPSGYRQGRTALTQGKPFRETARVGERCPTAGRSDRESQTNRRIASGPAATAAAVTSRPVSDGHRRDAEKWRAHQRTTSTDPRSQEWTAAVALEATEKEQGWRAPSAPPPFAGRSHSATRDLTGERSLSLQTPSGVWRAGHSRSRRWDRPTSPRARWCPRDCR